MNFPKKQLFSSKKVVEDRKVLLDAYVKIVAKISPFPLEVKRFLELTDQDWTPKISKTSAHPAPAGKSAIQVASLKVISQQMIVEFFNENIYFYL